jgi:hypothetical protein
MTEQSQMPLVGPPQRRGWAEIFCFRPLTTSTHATLVATRRGRLASILPAGGPRVLSDYLAWPYDFREVDARERLLTLDQRLESFDSNYEFLVSLRLIYQVVRPDRVALELDDVSTELTLAIVQSLRVSGRSFGVEQDKTFEEHLQATLISNDALAQRVQLLGLVLHRADVIVSLDEPTRAHAEALRFAMRERPLHFQVAVESLEPDRSFDVHVGGVYRLTERRAQDEPSDLIDGAIQTAIVHALRRVGITFEPGDYPNAAKAMAEMLRKDTLLQSELAMVHAQLLRPTVQIQPDRSMVHVPRASAIGVPETRPEPSLRRSRQNLPRMGRPLALEDMQERAPQPIPAPTVRRALPPPATPPAESATRQATWPEAPLGEDIASPTLPLGELPAPGEPIEGAYTLWPSPAEMPIMRALPTPGQPDDEADGRAPWADLIRSNDDQVDDVPWLAAPAESLSAPVEPLPWDSPAIDNADQPVVWDQASAWMADDPPAPLSAPVEPLPWDSPAIDNADQPVVWDQASAWMADPPAPLSAPVEPLPWELSATDDGPEHDAEQPATGAAWAFEEAESNNAAISESENEPPALVFLAPEPINDLGFSLEWSEPERAPVADLAAEALASPDDPIADDLGFSLDWSDPQIDPYAGVPLSNTDTVVDNGIVMAHWNDESAVPEPMLFGDPPIALDDSAAAATTAPDRWPTTELEQAPFAPQQVQESLPAALEQGSRQDEMPVFAEQEALAGYTPTLHYDEQLPFEPAADGPPESNGTTWVDLPIPSELRVDIPVEPITHTSLEAFAAVGADAPTLSEPSLEVDADEAVIDAPLEAIDTTWADTPMSSEPSLDIATDADIQSSDHVISVEPVLETVSDQVSADTSEQLVPQAESAAVVSPELIARLIGMIQSYGPAWFKMWSLELKERPERLPVVLGEVTADAALLAQADDSRVQSALLAALVAYTSPPVHPSRLASALLPSPLMASQNSDDQDEVPDWLSLRTKWNGHGGGA